ncbi:MAG: type II secretion system inner membrane protein GspF [Pseudomonadota bacterium]
MAVYRYTALDARGRRCKGVLEADGPRQARAQLRAQGLSPETLESAREEAAAGRPATRIAAASLALMTRQFAVLLEAGLTVEDALGLLIDQSEEAGLKQILTAVRAEVRGGQSLGRALAAHPKTFDGLYRAIVEAGEHAGALARVMDRLAGWLEGREALRQKWLAAMAYPVIVSGVALLMLIGLLTYVTPQVLQVFAQGKAVLPWPTRILIGLSEALRVTWPFLLGGLAVAVWAGRRALRQPALRLRAHALWLRLPVLGRLLRTTDTARFADTLAILVGAGVPLLTALNAAAGVLGNDLLRAQATEAATRVREGVSLSRALAQGGFSPVLTRLIASGEASGRLPELLDKAARQQGEELGRRLTRLTTLLEPLLILGMGVMVLAIVLAILMPIFEMNQIIR